AMVFDHATRAQMGGAFAAEMGVEQQAGLGEHCLRTREDLGQSDRSRVEDDRVAAFNDPKTGLPSRVRDAAECLGCEPFRMKRSIEPLERQVGDARSTEAYTHMPQVLSGSCRSPTGWTRRAARLPGSMPIFNHTRRSLPT